MKVIDILKTIYSKINNKEVKNAEKARPSRDTQDAYLSQLDVSEDHYENSYNKYRCVCFFHYSKVMLFFYNVAAVILYIPLYLRFRVSKKQKTTAKPGNLMVLKKGKTISTEDIFPEELKKQYTIKEYLVDYNKIYLDNDAKRILSEARKKHPFSFHYNLVLMIRIAIQCSIINEYSPSAVCTYVCEREFADPLLTLYSEERGVQYHGFMHGDFMYQIDHAFMQFSCYWVWDEHYLRMFQELKCSQPMRVYKPGKYNALVESSSSEYDYEYFATYYFSGETKASIEKLKEIFDKLMSSGRKCKLRPHPRFSNYEHIKKVFSGYTIEDCSTCSLRDSLATTYCCIAINSTVLSQAYHSGKPVIIDDITNSDEFGRLKDQEYIMLDKANCRLSDLLSNLSIR